VWQLAENRRLENERLRAERDRLAQEAEQRRQAELSESQRAQEAAQAAERRAQEAEAQALRYQIAAQFRIEPEDFDLLGSGSREEMENRAQRLSAHYAARQTPVPLPPPGSGRPVEDLRPGASPPDQPSEDDLVYERLYGPTRK
jgi:multidrug efflux pump subunit AcrA (membrane-fusion protein)